MTHFAFAAASELASAVVARSDLSAALAAASLVIEKRSTLPALSCARIVADGMGAAVIGTDMDMEIRVSMPGAVDSRLDLALNADRLSTLLRKAPASDMVAFSQPEWPALVKLPNGGERREPAIVVADFERVNFELAGAPGEDMPSFEDRAPAASFELPGSVLRMALERTAGAISTEETRYYLNGVFMHSDHAGRLVFAATDGHRLYRQELAVNAPEGMPGVILPRKLVSVLAKLIKGKACPETVSIDVSDSRVAFRFSNVAIRSKVIDGTFPDYNRVIPRNNENVATLEAGAFGEGLAAVLCMTSERGRAAKLVFGDDAVSLHVTDPEHGRANAKVPVSIYRGDAMEIGLNGRYLGEVLALCDGETDFAMADSGAPVLVTCEAFAGWLAVVMPMRV